MSDWINLMIELPADDADALMSHLKEQMGFADIDWCEMQRPDFARVSWGPCEPRTSSGYEDGS
jgi:hypothetical protein